VSVRRGIAVFGASLESMAVAAAAADGAGFHSVWTSELYNRSATVTLAALAPRTTGCVLGSGIMYGVGRSPLMLAAEARDLDELSHGRFLLGLGNGTRRMISDWHGQDPDAPAVRMEELVGLLRRLWRQHREPIDHEGRFYRLRLAPTGDLEEPLREEIPIYTAGVNPRMVEVAGRVADGLLGHVLFTTGYIEDVVLPAIELGAQRTGRDPGDVRVASLVLASVDDDPEVARREAAAMLAFYASAKTYAPVLERIGFADEAAAVRDAFARGDEEAMVAAIPDRMVDALAVAGTPEDVRSQLRRYEGLLDHAILYVPSYRISPERLRENALALIAACSTP
jgi:probable F420-dependent oxidoreductase